MTDLTFPVPPSVTMRTINGFVADLRDACADRKALTLDIDALSDADLSFVQAVQAARVHLGSGLTLTRAASGPLAALLIRAGFAGDPADIDFWFHGENPQ
jgi:hypothetical protein